jgi:hypothetical protein
MGKTFGAVQWARRIARSRRFPLLVVDTVAALNFRGWRRVASAADLAMAWKGGEWAWTPRDRGEVDGACDAIIRIGRIVVVVDESAAWLDSSRGRGGTLERLFRTARHPDVYVALTTQYAGADVSPQVLACRPTVYVFATPQPLGRITSQYGISEDAARGLRPRTCIRRD